MILEISYFDMCELLRLNWVSGSGKKTNFKEIIKILKDSIKKGSKVFIGSDSFTTKNKVNFASAICLYGGQAPSRYFFAREYLPQDNFNALVTRITEEVRRSVELAEHIMTNHDVNSDNIELHIDVSPFHMKNGTSKYCDMLKGYVTGAGFECRVKPQAWASQSVADKHSK
ncbi:MAG: hypothetical protein HN879_10280 [Flavobacteriaceae bacterium]|jgi:uncharacterized protein|nr:hypothetical protein [Flavobacteriaceae bacterium]